MRIVSIDRVQDQIVAEFAELGDWFDKYEYLITRGKELPRLDDQFKSDAYAMPGCQSQVWIVPRFRNGQVYFDADSDSLIVKGMISLLLRVVNGHAPGEVADADFYFLKRTGLRGSLSPTRANGVAAIIRRMRQLAADACKTSAHPVE